MASVRVTVAFALLAVGEVPVARLALVNRPFKGWVDSVACFRAGGQEKN